MNTDVIPIYYVLDLDRTIFDTIKAASMMEAVLARHNPELASLVAQRFEESSRLGESFSIRDFIVDQVGEEEMQYIAAKYKEAARTTKLLLPGARELMAYIDSLPGARYGILTYGSPLDQAMKIEASGLTDIPHSITQETYKGIQIASWRQDDGLYHIPEELGAGVSQSIILIDDKPFSFKGLPADCRGFMVRSVFDAGIKQMPLTVSAVNNLKQVITAEKKLRSAS